MVLTYLPACSCLSPPPYQPLYTTRVINLQFWPYGSWESLFLISMRPSCKLMSPEHYFFIKSLQYHCTLGLAEIKTLHPRDKIMQGAQIKYHCHPPSQPASLPRTFVTYQPPYPISLSIYPMRMVVFHAKVLALAFLIHCSVRQQLQLENNVN